MENFPKIKKHIESFGYNVTSYDFERPWGGFLVVNENQAEKFADQFFDNISLVDLKISGKLSPKILIVNSNSRLSWQYHHRRAEIWRVYKGRVGVSKSMNNNEQPMVILNEKDQIKLKQGERHRLIGLDDFGVVSEIWQHTDHDNPSDEEDIVRLSDDYGR